MKSLSKITNWYLSFDAVPFWVIFIIDCLVVFLSAIVIHALNNGTLYTLSNFWVLCGTLAIYLLIYIGCFHKFHTYASVVRYSSFVDLRNIAFAMGTAILLSAIFKYAVADKYLFPIRLRDILTWSITALFAMWLIRVIVKYWFDSIYNIQEVVPIYIYGIKEGGIALAKSIRSQKPTKYKVMGFITDNPEFAPYTLMGSKVYVADESLIEHILKDQIRAIFVSPLITDTLRADKRLVNELLQNDVKIYLMPIEQEWDTETGINHRAMKEVTIEDLLQREKITVNMNAIGEQLRGTKIMITGAAGSIGEEIVKQVASYDPAELVLIDQAETPLHNLRLAMARNFPELNVYIMLADISNAKRMDDIFASHKPEYVFHAAAYKHVPMMEEHPCESIHNNVVGTRIVADLAVKYGARKFVMISTDKAVNPTNVMGCSKRICEIYVQSLDKAIKEQTVEGCTQFVTTRFGNVLGSNGSVIPLFKEQIRTGGPVTVTHPDIIRYFMLISEACKLVLEAGTMGHGGEIYVFDMGQPVKILDLAQQMIKLSGATNVEIKFTGLRNGEKLYEEVLNDKEITLPTYHPKIKIAKVREYDYAWVCERIDEMERCIDHEDDMSIVRRMKQMVPEYKSQHSIFQALDVR